MIRLIAAASLACALAAAAPATAGVVPVTKDRFEGSKRVISLAKEKPPRRYRVRVWFADTGERVQRWMWSGQTIRITVGARPHSLEIRCVPKKARRGSSAGRWSEPKPGAAEHTGAGAR